MYTAYSVVIQAYNTIGSGPSSEETTQHTGEGTPEQAPTDVTCTALTSQSIRLSWSSPPLDTANGVIKGYKAVYGPSQLWFGKIIYIRSIQSNINFNDDYNSFNIEDSIGLLSVPNLV